MNSNQVRCFLEAGKEKNFTRAAMNLYMEQPNFSRTIASLERELGVKLFQRHADKTLSLTRQGEFYFDAFSKCVAAVDEAAARCGDLALQQTPVKIGYLFGWSIPDDILNKIDQFNNANPHLNIELECYNITTLKEKLQQQEIDACIIIEDQIKGNPGIFSQHLCKLPKVLIYAKSFLDSKKDRITPQDFVDQDFLVFEKSFLPYMGQELKAFFAGCKTEPKLKLVPNQETMISAVETGRGVAIMDMWSQPIYSSKISWIPFPGYHNIMLSWSKDQDTEEMNHLYTYLKNK